MLRRSVLPAAVFHRLAPSADITYLRAKRGTSSHTEHGALSDEEEGKGELVQSEMQMAPEDMSTTQSGTGMTSTCQFIHSKSNVTPCLNN
ncbi:hypothetical protein F2P81_010039 [Scophthalmus maximus]|uniref:Uncharacterized protein n=1 Tax=Scophthalmus maximus TaxID=52904 RepID=A0A6A4SWS1_SCOMX|nr:hypothetical protein F2P81_010039 [Scophthalmus maximus]